MISRRIEDWPASTAESFDQCQNRIGRPGRHESGDHTGHHHSHSFLRSIALILMMVVVVVQVVRHDQMLLPGQIRLQCRQSLPLDFASLHIINFGILIQL